MKVLIAAVSNVSRWKWNVTRRKNRWHDEQFEWNPIGIKNFLNPEETDHKNVFSCSRAWTQTESQLETFHIVGENDKNNWDILMSH